jgi:GNAT superfamily N-acetyltransferase
LKRTLLQVRLAGQEPIWLAELGGIGVGLIECGYTDATPGTWAVTRLPAGRWGYVNCASVLPGARGRGVGRALADHAHTAFAVAGAVGSYLYYNPPNPLSSVFWPRQGYRPLWTIWEARPASALR